MAELAFILIVIIELLILLWVGRAIPSGEVKKKYDGKTLRHALNYFSYRKAVIHECDYEVFRKFRFRRAVFDISLIVCILLYVCMMIFLYLDSLALKKMVA